MIGFIGKEVADAIAPIVMWAAIIGGVVFVLGWIARKIRGGIIAKDDLEEAVEAEQNEQEDLASLRKNRRRLRDLFRNKLSDGSDS
jgi:hypothetical protein